MAVRTESAPYLGSGLIHVKIIRTARDAFAVRDRRSRDYKCPSWDGSTGLALSISR